MCDKRLQVLKDSWSGVKWARAVKAPIILLLDGERAIGAGKFDRSKVNSLLVGMKFIWRTKGLGAQMAGRHGLLGEHTSCSWAYIPEHAKQESIQ